MRLNGALMLLIIATMITIGYTQEYPLQGTGSLREGSISGYVRDEATEAPIEYANIILYRQRDSSQVTGTITDGNGYFKLSGLRPGRYYLKIHFIGYALKYVPGIVINSNQRQYELGEIYIRQQALNMDGIVVEGEQPAIAYQIDKKVVSVRQHQTAASGSAVDILENVPSVSVDIEGNVSLRGSENFQVLIDGRPTVLESSEALQQIPASMIDNIEIITNPSAKYDPEGTTGIINVILRKGKQSGTSGMFDLNAGWNNKYGIDGLIYHKTNGLSITLGADYNQRHFQGKRIERQRTTQQGISSYVNSEGDGAMEREFLGFRTAIEYQMTDRDQLILGAHWGTRAFNRKFELDFTEWNNFDYDTTEYVSNSIHDRSGDHYRFNLNYNHNFAQKGHQFDAEAYYSTGESKGKSVHELMTLSDEISSGNKSIEKGPSSRAHFKLDYQRPLNNQHKIETGYHYRSNWSEEPNQLYTYNSQNHSYQLLPEYSYETHYSRNIHALYGLFANEQPLWGYQLGLRTEYTYRQISRPDTSQKYTIDRWDLFPSLHTSYRLTDKQQLMVSYSRRIHRPRSWYLEPFETWIDAYTVRKGNPGLKPEYIDSYETGYQMQFARHMLSFEAYYRVTHHKVERVRSVYAENVSLHTIDNVGKDFALGSEFNLRFNFHRKLRLNLMGSLYRYQIEGKIYDEPFSRQSNNWNARINTDITVVQGTHLQLNGMYHSPSVSAQGHREGFFITNLALKQEFWNRKVAATIQVRDIFGTGKREFTSEGRGFYSYSYRDRESPIIMLNVKININNYKNNRRQQEEIFPDEIESEEF